MLSQIKQKILLKNSLMPTTFIATFSTAVFATASLLMIYASVVIAGTLSDHISNEALVWLVRSDLITWGFYAILSFATLTFARTLLAPYQNGTKWMVLILSVILKIALVFYTIAEISFYCELDVELSRKILFSSLKALMLVVLFVRLDTCLVRMER